MAIKELNIKHTRIPSDFLPISIRENIEECFVEFVTESGESFDISCHGNKILVRAHSRDNQKKPKLKIENSGEVKPGHTRQVIFSIENP